MEFRSVHDLLDDGISIAAIATAIEASEVGVWDEYGRFVRAENEQKLEILAALAEIHQINYRDFENRDTPHPLDIYPYDDMSLPLNRFGWGTDNKDDIEELFSKWIDKNAFEGVISSRNLRRNSAEYSLIDALTILAFDEDTLNKLKTRDANGLGKLRSELSKIDFDISEKSLSRIYRK